MAKAKSGWVKCELCGAKMRAEKLDAHNRRVHPKGARTSEERRRIEGRRRKVRGTAKWLIAAIIIVVVIFVAYVVLSTSDIRGVNVGDKPPNFTLTDTHGLEWTMDDFLGEKPIFMDFMQIGCGHCLNTAKALGALEEKYSGQIEIVISLSSNANSMSDVRDWAATNDINLTVLFDKDGKVFDVYKIPTSIAPYGSFPTTYVINKEGKVHHKSIGAKDQDHVEKLIKEVV